MKIGVLYVPKSIGIDVIKAEASSEEGNLLSVAIPPAHTQNMQLNTAKKSITSVLVSIKLTLRFFCPCDPLKLWPIRVSAMDVVVLVMTRLNHWEEGYRVRLHVIPAFARAPLAWVGDEDILEATRLFLMFTPVLEDAIRSPYANVKRLEATGATCYMALPRTSPCGMLRAFEPASLYTFACASRYAMLLDLRPRDLFPFLWHVVVPDACARCGGEDTWALSAPFQTVCQGCGYSECLSDQRRPLQLGLA